MNISPRRVEAAMSAAMQLLADLPPDDALLRRDTIEGETDVFALMDQIAEWVLADEARAELARDRARRLEARADRHRAVVVQMLEQLDLREPLQRAFYTASLSYLAKPKVTDATILPRDFVKETVDMVKLGKALRAGTKVDGAELGNAQPSLTLRTM